VVHLAAQAGVRYSLRNPHAYTDTNVSGFLNILEGCRHNACEHLVYASSSSVYGANRKLPFSVHDTTDHPVSLYAASKKANELMAHTYSHLYRLPTTGLRFFTVYGLWAAGHGHFLFTRAILDGQPIDVYNEGRMRRLYIHRRHRGRVLRTEADPRRLREPFLGQLPRSRGRAAPTASITSAQPSAELMHADRRA
jgi:UDP-glucuronate 4-epimerase